MATSFSCATALPVNTSHFEAGDGPILLDNVTCNKSHLNLSQCVHPLNIGIHDCERDNTAGVICLNISSTTNTPVTHKNAADTKIISSTTLTNTSVTKNNGADTKVISNISQSALFGSVGAALAVGAIAVACIVFIVVAVKRKKKNNNGILKGISNTKCDFCFHQISTSNYI